MSSGLLRTMVDGLIAKSLEARGYEPVFLVERDELWHEEYLRGFGFGDFLYVEDYRVAPALWRETARELLADCRSQQDLLDLTFRGALVGQFAAFRALQSLRRGSVDPA